MSKGADFVGITWLYRNSVALAYRRPDIWMVSVRTASSAWVIRWNREKQAKWVMADCAAPSRKRKRVRHHSKRFCEHCNCFVSKSTWYNHQDRTIQPGCSSLSNADIMESDVTIKVGRLVRLNRRKILPCNIEQISKTISSTCICIMYNRRPTCTSKSSYYVMWTPW